MRKLLFIIIGLTLFSCGNKVNNKQKKLDDLTSKRTEVEVTKKTYVDSVNALNIPNEQFMEYNRAYNKAKEFNENADIPKDLNRLWKKLDEIEDDIKSYDEQILSLSKEIDEIKKAR